MKTVTHDAIAMLIADHKKVKTLFRQFDVLSDRSLATKKRLGDQICQELTIHTQLEEQIFYPALRGAIKDNDLMDEALVEHAGAKALIAQLLLMEAGESLYDARVTVLSEQVEHHVAEEEGVMFLKARNSDLDMLALGKKMAALKEELMSVAA